ncbi:cyclic nucleotide-binding domain-containing protein [Thermosynechococcaceae cyanobacterium Okahandja]
MNKCSFTDQDLIYRTGDAANVMYFIKAGQVELIDEFPETGQHVTAVLGPGKVFGEVDLIHGRTRLCTARAKGEVKLFQFTEAELKDALFENHVKSLMLSRTLYEHLRDLYSDNNLESELARLRVEMQQTVKKAVIDHEARVVKSHNGMMAIALPIVVLVGLVIALQFVFP